MDEATLKTIESIVTGVVATLGVVTPIIAAAYYKLNKKWKSSMQEARLKDREKSLDILKNYTYSESMRCLSDIKYVVNMYRDKSQADRVCYYSLEDGTVAESKLHNMYITMSTESDRFSQIPRYIQNVQRLPVPQVLGILSEFNNRSEGIDSIKAFEVPSDEKDHLVHKSTQSWKVRNVCNADGYIIGYIMFLYKELTYEDYVIMVSSNEIDSNKVIAIPNQDSHLISECRAVIESKFIAYTKSVKEKRVELGLDEMSINYEKK